MKRIPARITWPIAIVALLIANIGVAVGTLVLANWDGGVQVVPDYYAEAVAWDSLAAVRNDVTALGWSVDVTADRPAGAIQVLIKDVQGDGVSGLTGSIILARPHLSLSPGSGVLVAVGEPGMYQVSGLDLGSPGLYDVSIEARLAHQLFVATERIDVP
ncbi:MAG: hypothetical protein HKN43_08550 [Rhodothermales bacterium]|nr:hypothetical protein [Rhodothermales bacterium]